VQDTLGGYDYFTSPGRVLGNALARRRMKKTGALAHAEARGAQPGTSAAPVKRSFVAPGMATTRLATSYLYVLCDRIPRYARDDHSSLHEKKPSPASLGDPSQPLRGRSG
jgi:hypothetical protein